MINIRTADELRPKCFDDIVGQAHLFGEHGVVRKMIGAGRVTNMIFYGPPGTGKTTAAEIIARESDMVFHKLNATSASLSDVKGILSSTDSIFCTGGVLLYIDEIQYFNKKQQQSLLEYIEDGRVTLIASTTENPHFYVYNAIISRSSLFEFKPVAPKDCAKALRRALDHLNREGKTEKRVSEETLEYIAKILRHERPDAIVPGIGGQTGLNLAMQLEKKGILKECGVQLLGTSSESIERAEDRELFKELCQSIGEPVIPSEITYSLDEAKEAAFRRPI